MQNNSHGLFRLTAYTKLAQSNFALLFVAILGSVSVRNCPILLVILCVYSGPTSVAQDQAKTQMPELAFLNKLKGEWKASGVHIRGAHFDTGVTSQLDFGEEGVQFIHIKPNGKTKRLLKYEKFNLPKNEINLIYQNEKKLVSRYSLKLKDGKLYIAIRSDIGKQNVLPDNRLPNAENLAWVYERVMEKK